MACKGPQSWPQSSWPSSSPACLFASCILQLLCVRIRSPHTPCCFPLSCFLHLLFFCLQRLPHSGLTWQTPPVPPRLTWSLSSLRRPSLHTRHTPLPTSALLSATWTVCFYSRLWLLGNTELLKGGTLSLVPVSPAHGPSRQPQLKNEWNARPLFLMPSLRRPAHEESINPWMPFYLKLSL